MKLAPSDLTQYYYPSSPNTDIRYKKDDSITRMVACSIVSADIPPEEEDAGEEDDPLSHPRLRNLNWSRDLSASLPSQHLMDYIDGGSQRSNFVDQHRWCCFILR